MFILDVFGYATEIHLMNIAAGLLGVFTDGWIFTNGNITYTTAFDPTSSTFKNQTVDPNLIVAVVAVMTIVSFIIVFDAYEKSRK